MRPKPPRGLSTKHHNDEWYAALAGAIVGGAWEIVRLVLFLAGARPQGQLPQAFGRVTAAAHLASTSHPIPGGWAHVLWDPARPVSPVAVVFLSVGLLLVIIVAVRTFRRLRGWGGGGQWWPRPRRAGPTPGQQAPAPTVDKSLDEWLASVAAGDNE